MVSDRAICLGLWSWIRMVGFWYIGLGEAMGVIDGWYVELNIWTGIGTCEEEDVGLE
jgi:hypothetical protein